MKWKVIPFSPLYEISEDGRVKNSKTGRILVLYNDGRYLRVSIVVSGKPKTFTVHRLVAICYLSYVSGGKLIVDHKDNNKHNNHYTNLQLISQRENVSKDLNKSVTSSSYIGVVWKKSHKKWQASIKIQGKKKHLGLYNNEEDAHIAYQTALQSLE